MGERLTLREKHLQQTRSTILESAFILFEEQGFGSTTVEQIAERAGLSPRTIFRHFPMKEDLVFADHGAAVAGLAAMFADEDLAHLPPLQRIQTALLSVQNLSGNPNREQLRARIMADEPTVRARAYHLSEELEDVVAQYLTGELGDRDQTGAIAHVITGVLFGALRGARRAVASNHEAAPTQVIQIAFDIARDGVASLLPSRD